MKLSIITINLNNKHGLEKTIQSVIFQSYEDYEYIVIDGASTDGSVDVIKKYADKVTYWISEPDKGIYNAMNKGILRAKGDYCLFLNSGDYLIEQNILTKVFSLNINTDIFCESFREKKPFELTFFDFYTDSLKHQSMFIRRSLFEKIGLYDENYKIISDWGFYVLGLIKYNCSLEFYYFPLFIPQEGGISWIDGKTQRIEKTYFMDVNFPYFITDYSKLSQYNNSRLIDCYNKLFNNRFIKLVYSFLRNPQWKRLKWIKLTI